MLDKSMNSPTSNAQSQASMQVDEPLESESRKRIKLDNLNSYEEGKEEDRFM